MDIKRFTLVSGVLFVLIGILGFIPGITTAPMATDPGMAVDQNYGRLFGLFPVNMVHNLVHLAFGAWGLVAFQNLASSRIYCRSTAIIYAVLTVFGLIPGAATLFGLAPMFGHDVWLHAVIAIGSAYYGYVQVSDDLGVKATRRSGATDSSFRWS